MKRAHQLSLLKYMFNPKGEKDHAFVVHLRQQLALLAPKSRWRALLRILAQLPLDRADGRCDCVDERVKHDWIHQNHAKFNQQVRDSLEEFGAREGMLKAMYTLGYSVFPDSGSLQPRQHLLKDFLSPTPQFAWFKGAP